MKKNFIRALFSLILSLFITILVLAVGLSHFAMHHICDEEYMQKISSASNFTNELYEEIRYDWENLISITGITEQDSILSVLTPQIVKEDTIGYITSSYTGKATLNTDSLRANLDSKIRDYANSHNINAIPDAELEKNITDLVDACIKDYRTSVCIPMLPKILSSVTSLAGYLDIIMLGATIGIALLLLFLFAIQRKKQDIFYYTALSGLTNSALLIGGMYLIGYHEIISRIPFEDSALKTLISDYLQSLVTALQQYGYYYLIAAIICLTIYLMIQAVIRIVRKAKTKTTSEKE